MVVRMLTVIVLLIVAVDLLTAPNSSVANDARIPTETIRPFDQKDLGSFSSWLKETGNEDPRRVFRLENGILRCGDEDMGYLATREAYRDYHLSVEYRWGRKNPHDKYVRNSGVLLQAEGHEIFFRNLELSPLTSELNCVPN